MNRAAGWVVLGALAALGACHSKGTLEGSQVEYMTVEGQRYEVRVAPTDIKDEYRMLTVRATLVLAPDPEAERNRDWTAAKQVMDRTCRARPYAVLDHRIADNVNFYARFRCE